MRSPCRPLPALILLAGAPLAAQVWPLHLGNETLQIIDETTGHVLVSTPEECVVRLIVPGAKDKEVLLLFVAEDHLDAVIRGAGGSTLSVPKGARLAKGQDLLQLMPELIPFFQDRPALRQSIAAFRAYLERTAMEGSSDPNRPYFALALHNLLPGFDEDGGEEEKAPATKAASLSSSSSTTTTRPAANESPSSSTITLPSAPAAATPAPAQAQGKRKRNKRGKAQVRRQHKNPSSKADERFHPPGGPALDGPST